MAVAVVATTVAAVAAVAAVMMLLLLLFVLRAHADVAAAVDAAIVAVVVAVVVVVVGVVVAAVDCLAAAAAAVVAAASCASTREGGCHGPLRTVDAYSKACTTSALQLLGGLLLRGGGHGEDGKRINIVHRRESRNDYIFCKGYASLLCVYVQEQLFLNRCIQHRNVRMHRELKQ